jgi:hypothetical protein
MRRFVFWTGMSSLSVGLGLQFQGLAACLMPSAEPGMLLHLSGLMAIFLGFMLMLCSRDLRRRGSLVIWEGILRVCLFGVMGSYGLFGAGGTRLAMAGFGDLIIGVVYFVWLPRHLQVSFMDLLLDRRIES